MAKRFKVYQQLDPTLNSRRAGVLSSSYEPNLVFVTTMVAESGVEAIEKAKKIPLFKYSRRDTLAAFPLVEQTFDKRSLH